MFLPKYYFNTFMFDHTLHRGRKHFCNYWLQACSTEEISKTQIKDCFKIKANKELKCLINGFYSNLL